LVNTRNVLYGDVSVPAVLAYYVGANLASGTLARIYVTMRHFDLDLRPSKLYSYAVDWTVA
jgi:hypothetical protein